MQSRLIIAFFATIATGMILLGWLFNMLSENIGYALVPERFSYDTGFLISNQMGFR